MGVRCGNHSTRIYHENAEEVRACFEGSRRYVTGTPQKISGWWDLPIAASMWAADARDIER